MIYSFEQALQASTDYFNGDELAAKVWVTKYALKDSYGNIFELTPKDMHWRLSYEIARVERKYANSLSADKLFALFDQFKYIVPQGGPMTGIGNPYQISSLSNCFVIGEGDRSDSYGSILKSDEEQIQLMKRRGGVGHDLTYIRPKGSPVKNSALTSTGLTPFMERYSNSTREVAQDGRRGALMLSVSINHPDAESFIDAKTEQGKITGANISVRIDDKFMKAAINGEAYTQQFPVDSANPLVKKDINAPALWKKIVHNAWKSAEPGVLFWDTIIKESVPDCYADLGFETVSTNPCGEIPLCPYDSCRLLAINLYSYVVNPFKKSALFDWAKFEEHAVYAQRIMDDIIDLEIEKIDAILAKIEADPEPDETKRAEKILWEKIKNKTLKGRRTGVGITAEGDMLAALGFVYGTAEATEFAEEVQRTLATSVYLSSVNLAKERGAFEVFDIKREENNPFIQRLFSAEPDLKALMTKYGRRNIACLTIAPTGTTSLMTQTTSGVEPAFLPVYKRRRKVNPNDQDVRVDYVDINGDCWEEYIVFHHHFGTWMKVNGYDPNNHYSPEDIDKLVKASPYYKATSNDVDWVEKVRMQGALQKWVDHSISTTVNIPNGATEDLVNQIYIEAWRSGCKGCTIYRDGSRDGVLVSATEKTKQGGGLGTTGLPHRPKKLEADVVYFKNNKEKWIAFVGKLEGKPYEIFTGLSDDDDGIVLPKSVTTGYIIKNTASDGTRSYDFQFTNKMGHKTTVEGINSKFNPEFWNYARLISGVLRYGIPIDQAVKLAQDLELDSDTINTWKNGVVRVLKQYIPNGAAEGQTCPHCNQESLVYQEGCLRCTNCGHSKCG